MLFTPFAMELAADLLNQGLALLVRGIEAIEVLYSPVKLDLYSKDDMLGKKLEETRYPDVHVLVGIALPQLDRL